VFAIGGRNISGFGVADKGGVEPIGPHAEDDRKEQASEISCYAGSMCSDMTRLRVRIAQGIFQPKGARADYRNNELGSITGADKFEGPYQHHGPA
jgi:hypothetical protein